MSRTDAERAAWVDRQLDKEEQDRRVAELAAQFEGYPSVDAAELGRWWDRQYALNRAAIEDRLAPSPLVFGRRQWRERRDRLLAELADEYRQIHAAIVAGEFDMVSALRGEFLAKEVYAVLRGELP